MSEPVEEILKKKTEDILSLIRGSSTGSTQQEKEAEREFYVGVLNFKLSKQTEVLNKRIFWLNFILVGLTIILVILSVVMIVK